MSKRTYSRRNMTMVPSAFSSPPDSTSTSKRRKSSPRDEAEAELQSMSSSKSARQKPQSKKFSGPISMSYDEMGVDNIPPAQASAKDPFVRLLNNYKAGEIAPARTQGPLHGGREEFDSLIKMKKPLKPQLKDGRKANINSFHGSLKAMGKAAAKSIEHAISPSNGKNVEPLNAPEGPPSKTEVLAMAKRAFEAREYQSSTTPPPSEDLGGNCIDAQSKAFILWSENQANSPLLRLPNDVLKRIYELALGGHVIEIFYRSYRLTKDDDGTVSRWPHFKYGSIVCKGFHNPSNKNGIPRIEKTKGMSLLSGVCRQLYLETSTLPYKLNNISFRTYNIMFNFFVMERRLTRSQLEAITQLTVQHDLPGQNVLNLLPNLQRVRLLGEEKAKKPFGLKLKKTDEWSPPSGGWYHVVDGNNGRKLEKGQAWMRFRGKR